jgi:voltage-gated potassium channel
LESEVLLKKSETPETFMVFAREAGVAIILVSITLSVQCAGMAFLIRLARTCIIRSKNDLNPWLAGVLIVRFSAAMIVLHILQILLWASFYRWRCLPTWESCFYFSASSYSTVGYGDIVLPRVWRVLGPVESVTGVLMCGMSVSGLFAIASHLVAAERTDAAMPL